MSSQRLRICLIGLGNMGSPIGRHWLRAGHDVVGFDLIADVCAAFEQQGGRTASTAAEAATGADVVVLLLPNSTVVDAVLTDLLAARSLRSGSTVIDMSSSEPQRTQYNAANLATHGLALIDAPVSGGVSGAENGTLTIMAGGERDALNAQRELLEHVGRVIHIGGAGSGHAVKALNNLLSAVHLWMTSEAVLIGEEFGIDPKGLLEVINRSSGRSGSSEAKWPKFILPETFDSGFSARLMLKDARIATQLAAAVGRPTLLGQNTVEEWSRAVADLPPHADHTEIVRWLRGRSPTTTHL